MPLRSGNSASSTIRASCPSWLQPWLIFLAHGLRAGGDSQPHRDPFDRMLVAQAELERLVLLTADPQLFSFPCQTF